jgi:hypothetical protein
VEHTGRAGLAGCTQRSAAAVAVRGLQAEMVACVHAEADKSAGLETQYVKNAVERFRYQVAPTVCTTRTRGDPRQNCPFVSLFF